MGLFTNIKNEKQIIPRYKLIKSYPGMTFPVGTVFGNVPGWICLRTRDGHGSTEWEEEYFQPWIGIYFEIIKWTQEK